MPACIIVCYCWFYCYVVGDGMLQAGQATEPECMIAVGLVANGGGQVGLISLCYEHCMYIDRI